MRRTGWLAGEPDGEMADLRRRRLEDPKKLETYNALRVKAGLPEIKPEEKKLEELPAETPAPAAEEDDPEDEERECEVCGELLTLDEHDAGVCSGCQLEAERV